MNEEDLIIEEIKKNNSIVIVGASDSGKTYWVQNTLIPKLREIGKLVAYSEDGFNNIAMLDVAIFDEAETLFDANELKIKYPEENPYYSEKYIEQVKNWFSMYSSHTEPSIYIISRRKNDIQFLLENFKKSDWDNRNLKLFSFPLE